MSDITAIIGAAGHIDHGKTTLIHALTGVNCDRLEEEKRRGMTIDIGFARLTLPDGRSIGVIDAPGHKKFVHNMVAGAVGVDVGLLVVAADDGVMPQTMEHLSILELLDVKRLVVALTRTDLVDEETTLLASGEIEELLAHSPFAESEIIPCSAITGKGVEQVRQALIDAALGSAHRPGDTFFRLPIDRSFVVKGRGVVVTGTVAAGSLAVGEKVALYPGGEEAKVRGIESYGAPVETVTSGVRAAINLSGLEREEVKRGMTLAPVGVEIAERRFLCSLSCHPEAPFPIEHGVTCLLYIETAERLAKVYLLVEKGLKPGESALAQIRFDEPAPLVYGDRFIVRDSGAGHTLGGGVVLQPGGPIVGRRWLRSNEDHLESLKDFDNGLTAVIDQHPLGMPVNALSTLFFRPEEVIVAALKKKKAYAVAEWKGDRFAYQSSSGKKAVTIVAAYVASFHESHQELAGAAEAEVINALFPGETYAPYWIRRAVSAGKIELTSGLLKIPGHFSTFDGQGGVAARTIEEAYQNAGWAPPKTGRLHEILNLDKKIAAGALKALTYQGIIVPLTPDTALHRDRLEQAKESLLSELGESGSVTSGRFRDLLAGAGRKIAIEILEYFDRQGMTKRVDDKGTRVRATKG